MRKIIHLSLLLPLLAGLYCKKEAKMDREGIINALVGSVNISDQKGRSAAKVGDAVKKGMKIETGENSYVDIYFDENAIKVLEKSEVEVTELLTDLKGNSEKSSMRLKKGKVFAKVARKLAKDDSFDIGTPTMTAGVRGTEFLVSEDKGRGLVACLKGTVAVKNEASPEKGSVDVAEQKEVVVEKDKDMTVKDLSADNRRLMEDITRNFQDAKKDIRERFEKKREEIRKAVEDQRTRNKESVDKQKALDKQNVEDQKARDKENIDKLKGISDKTTNEAKDNINRQKEDSQKSLQGVKPDVKKFKSTVK